MFELKVSLISADEAKDKRGICVVTDGRVSESLLPTITHQSAGPPLDFAVRSVYIRSSVSLP